MRVTRLVLGHAVLVMLTGNTSDPAPVTLFGSQPTVAVNNTTPAAVPWPLTTRPDQQVISPCPTAARLSSNDNSFTTDSALWTQLSNSLSAASRTFCRASCTTAAFPLSPVPMSLLCNDSDSAQSAIQPAEPPTRNLQAQNESPAALDRAMQPILLQARASLVTTIHTAKHTLTSLGTRARCYLHSFTSRPAHKDETLQQQQDRLMADARVEERQDRSLTSPSSASKATPSAQPSSAPSRFVSLITFWQSHCQRQAPPLPQTWSETERQAASQVTITAAVNYPYSPMHRTFLDAANSHLSLFWPSTLCQHFYRRGLSTFTGRQQPQAPSPVTAMITASLGHPPLIAGSSIQSTLWPDSDRHLPQQGPAAQPHDTLQPASPTVIPADVAHIPLAKARRSFAAAATRHLSSLWQALSSHARFASKEHQKEAHEASRQTSHQKQQHEERHTCEQQQQQYSPQSKAVTLHLGALTITLQLDSSSAGAGHASRALLKLQKAVFETAKAASSLLSRTFAYDATATHSSTDHTHVSAGYGSPQNVPPPNSPVLTVPSSVPPSPALSGAPISSTTSWLHRTPAESLHIAKKSALEMKAALCTLQNGFRSVAAMLAITIVLYQRRLLAYARAKDQWYQMWFEPKQRQLLAEIWAEEHGFVIGQTSDFQAEKQRRWHAGHAVGVASVQPQLQEEQDRAASCKELLGIAQGRLSKAEEQSTDLMLTCMDLLLLDMRIEVMLQAKMEGKLKRREAAAEAASALDLAQSTVEQLQKAATKLQRQTHSLQEAADINNSAMVLLEGAVNCDGMTPIKTVEVVKILLAGQKDLLPACS